MFLPPKTGWGVFAGVIARAGAPPPPNPCFPCQSVVKMYVALTTEYIQSLMPTSLFNSYQAWLTNNPEKEGRLTEIIQQTAIEFRSAIQANGLPLTDTGETAVPRSCARSALAIILFEVRNELGIAQTEAENIAAVRADVFLRGIWTGTIPVTADPQSHSPSYSPPEN